MDYPNHTTNSCKHKRLNYQEHVIIQFRLNDGYSPYKMAKELGRASNTMRNEIACGTVSQIKQGKLVKVYLADACFGYALSSNLFQRSEMVCTKTKRVRTNKRRLGTSIEERPADILTREEFGHWEIDTVIGTKDKNDSVLLTLAERQTRQFIVRKIASKTTDAVQKELAIIKEYFGDQFSQVFKSITNDNGHEFAELYKLEDEHHVKVYFTHPYSSCERGTNERHNGLLRRFLPKGNSLNEYTSDEIAFIEDWCNALPRKILKYQTSEECFENQLDLIDTTK